MKQSQIKNNLQTYDQLESKLFIKGIIVGFFAGMISIVYRFLLQNAEHICDSLIAFFSKNFITMAIWIAILLLLGLIIGYFVKKQPYISGSGIPQVEAEVMGLIDQPWYQVLFSKIAAGTLSIIGGLSLGREGPSIQLGALTGKGISQFMHCDQIEKRYMMTCGAAAGLSAAFNAPLAGVMFALEEIHKNFSTSAIVSVMCASITGDFISKNVFGLTPVLNFPLIETLPLYDYLWVILLGMITGLAGVFYNDFTGKMQDLFARIPFMQNHNKVLIPLFLAGIFSFVLPQVLGGGHKIIEMIETNPTLSFLVILLIFKFLFSIISFASGAPGGIFFPLLILGCLIGAIYGNVMHTYIGIDEIYMNNFIIMAMVGFFAGIVRAPLTGIILIAEMSGSLKQLLPLALVAFIAYYVANSLNSEPIYESLLHRLLKKEKKPIQSRVVEKVLVNYVVALGSSAEGQLISEISWPKKCLVVSIVRGEGEIIPKGDTRFYVGDTVIMMIDQDGSFLRNELEMLFNSK